MLEENEIQYFDRNLSWSNAYLKEYSYELDLFGNKDDVAIYGVELQEKDCSHIPYNYIRIDHHNDMSGRPASIIQAAEVLEIPVSRYRQLVAANDSGYIPGMMQIGATKDEINAIRRLDREMQGVTETDEILAEKAILEKSTENGIVIIKAYSSRFSPICDRLFPYGQLIVYTDDELIYYGTGKAQLTNTFAEELAKGKMYHGGSDEGYIGTVAKVFPPAEIAALKNRIVNLKL